MESLTNKTLNIFWQHALKYKRYVVAVFVLLVVHSIGETAGPYMYRLIINELATYDYTRYNHLLWLLGITIIIRMIRSYAFRLKDYLQTKVQSRAMDDINNTCFDYIHLNSYTFFSGNFVGSIVNKVKKMERGFDVVADQVTDNFFRTFLAISFSVAVLCWRNWILGLSLLVWCIIYIAIIYYFSLYKLKYDIKKAEIDTRLTAQLADTITNNTNIKLFSAFGRESKAFRKLTDEHDKMRQFSWNLMTGLEVIQGTLMFCLEGLIMFEAIHFWRLSLLQVGDFILIQSYIWSVFDRLWGLGKQVRMFYEAIADANEMTEILLTPHEVLDKPKAKKLSTTTGKVEFNNVGFYYHKNDRVLENFNLTVNGGEKLALIGPSGGGKSTIVKLLLRLHDIQGGEILIDGQNIASVTQDSLRDKVSLVPQDPILFHRTLMENIRYSKPEATDEEVIEAAKSAHAHDFILKSKDGYKTYVGERGIKLSGGQRQRVAIARAILKNAPILVLDEATSSLDSESEMLIQDALKNLMKDKTVIVIAHRLSTIMQMDRIVVLEEGKITEEGKHKELLKAKDGTYQRLWNIQAGGFA